MLESSELAGFGHAVLVPSGRGLPLSVPIARNVSSPQLVVRGKHRVLTAGAAAERLGWLLYKRSPPPAQLPVAAFRRAQRRRAGYDHVLGREPTATEQQWLAAELRRLRPDVVVFDSVFSVVPVPSPARTILLVSDLITERAKSLTSQGYRVFPPDVDRTWERERMRTVDGIVTIQWDDATTIREQLSVPVVTAPPTFPWRPAATQGRDCVLVGSGALHNVDGLRWLLSDVWPHVLADRPGAVLNIVGTVGSQIRAGAGVRVRGEVGDLTRAYHDAAVALVPLRVGSGLKVKLAEAICHGRATVTTSVGAQGLGHLDPKPFVVHDDPRRFARSVIELLADGCQRAALEQAAATARLSFDPMHAHAPLVALMAGLAERSGG